jgi:hypothetical protein
MHQIGFAGCIEAPGLLQKDGVGLPFLGDVLLNTPDQDPMLVLKNYNIRTGEKKVLYNRVRISEVICRFFNLQVSIKITTGSRDKK